MAITIAEEPLRSVEADVADAVVASETGAVVAGFGEYRNVMAPQETNGY